MHQFRTVRVQPFIFEGKEVLPEVRVQLYTYVYSWATVAS